MLKTTDQRLEWLEKINGVVTQAEFKVNNKFVDKEFVFIENSLIGKIVMVDDRVSSLRWFLGGFIALGIAIFAAIISYGQILISLSN